MVPPWMGPLKVVVPLLLLPGTRTGAFIGPLELTPPRSVTVVLGDGYANRVPRFPWVVITPEMPPPATTVLIRLPPVRIWPASPGPPLDCTSVVVRMGPCLVVVT